MGQPRVNVPALEQILREAGLERGMRVGTVGWKYYTEADGCPPGSIEIPHFIVEALQAVGAEVRNGTQLFMSPGDGLRTVLDAEEIVAYEYAACLVARSILRVMDEAAPGKTEMELAAPMQNMGLPLSVHPMLSVGEKARFGLTSPTDRVAARGDFLTTAYGIEGALTCRAAFLAAGPQDFGARDPGLAGADRHALLHLRRPVAGRGGDRRERRPHLEPGRIPPAPGRVGLGAATRVT